MKKDILQTFKITLLALVVTLGVNYVFAWTGPTAAPPANNTPTPINVGTSDQVKNGGLSTSSLYTTGITRSDGGMQVDGNTVIDNNAGWHRSYGNTGWYNGTYGGGLYMIDTTWLRAYNNKSFYTAGTMRADSDVRSAKYCDINGANCTAVADLGGSGATTWSSITGKPAGFADNIDDVGSLTCVTKTSSSSSVSCDAGYVVTGGSCKQNDAGLLSVYGLPVGNTGWACYDNGGGSGGGGKPYARCCKVN
jgi:hypothetical protein